MLLLPKQGLSLKESGGRENLVKIPDSGQGKVIFALLNEIVVVYMGFILYTSKVLTLGSFSWSLSKFLGSKVLDFKTIFRIRCKLPLVYFGTKKTVRVDPRLEKPTKWLEKRPGKGSGTGKNSVCSFFILKTTKYLSKILPPLQKLGFYGSVLDYKKKIWQWRPSNSKKRLSK